MPLTRKMKRRFVFVFFLALLVFGLVMTTGKFRENFSQIVGFQWVWLPVALALVFVNFSLRELKWEFFRRAAGIEAKRMDNALIYFSGYSMCVSPGRFGEIIKPIMYKEYLNKPLHKTLPLVFCERLTDLLGMLVICGATFYHFWQGVAANSKTVVEPGNFSAKMILPFMILSLVALAAIVGIARSRRLIHGMLNFLGGFAKLTGLVQKVRQLYDSTYPLLTAYNLTSMTLFACFSWFFECWGTYVISRYGMGIESVDIVQIMFIFCFSSIIGGLFFFLPGGLGAFEVAMIGCFVALGVPGAQGRVINIVCRFATLFFGAAVGIVAIVLTTRHFHKSVQWDELEHAAEEAKIEDQ